MSRRAAEPYVPDQKSQSPARQLHNGCAGGREIVTVERDLWMLASRQPKGRDHHDDSVHPSPVPPSIGVHAMSGPSWMIATRRKRSSPTPRRTGHAWESVDDPFAAFSTPSPRKGCVRVGGEIVKWNSRPKCLRRRFWRRRIAPSERPRVPQAAVVCLGAVSGPVGRCRRAVGRVSKAVGRHDCDSIVQHTPEVVAALATFADVTTRYGGARIDAPVPQSEALDRPPLSFEPLYVSACLQRRRAGEASSKRAWSSRTRIAYEPSCARHDRRSQRVEVVAAIVRVRCLSSSRRSSLAEAPRRASRHDRRRSRS